MLHKPRNQTARIAIDAMSGDYGAGEVVKGLSLAFKTKLLACGIDLVGDKGVLGDLLRLNGLDRGYDICIHHAPDVIAMTDYSMMRALELVKEGQSQIAISCGNTGALVMGASLRIRTMEGIRRPMIAAIVPHLSGHFVLADAGANPESIAQELLINAVLANEYCKIALGISQPRVGLLTIGKEEGKGNGTTAEAHSLLGRISGDLNYIGLVEGFDVFSGHCDVIICDGFVGNILLKSWESLVHMFGSLLRKQLHANPMRSAGALLASGAFRSLTKSLNPDEYNGAPLLGLNGNVLKAHGSSRKGGVKSAILMANKILVQNLRNRVEERVGHVLDEIETWDRS